MRTFSTALFRLTAILSPFIVACDADDVWQATMSKGRIENDSVYINDVLGMSMVLPKGWITDKDQDKSGQQFLGVEEEAMEDLLLLHRRSPTSQAQIQVSCFPEFRVETSEEEYAEWLASIMDSLVRAKGADVETSVRGERIGGVGGNHITHAMKGSGYGQGRRVRVDIHIVRRGNHFVLITCSCDTESNCTTVEAAIESVRFD